MNKYYSEILAEIKKHANSLKADRLPDGYSGSKHKTYNLKTAESRRIAKEFSQRFRERLVGEFLTCLDSLYKGESYEEKVIASMLIGYSPHFRGQIGLERLEEWLGYLEGWAEIDSLCQSNFTDKDLLENWVGWKNFLRKLAKDEHIASRRASLVFLTGPSRRSSDLRIVNLAFENMDRLKGEKDILITKAISWLLRDLTIKHKERVIDYLRVNFDSLPKIAIRETKRKIEIGRK